LGQALNPIAKTSKTKPSSFGPCGNNFKSVAGRSPARCTPLYEFVVSSQNVATLRFDVALEQVARVQPHDLVVVNETTEVSHEHVQLLVRLLFSLLDRPHLHGAGVLSDAAGSAVWTLEALLGATVTRISPHSSLCRKTSKKA
jgi:hypothetical protein